MPTPPPEVRRQLSSLPDSPGVYLFKDEQGEVIYVGKAVSLRKRAPQHFKGPVVAMPISDHVDKVRAVDFIETTGEVEAMFLEANLIKRHQPLYNVTLKDDKRYPYIKLTKEEFPRIAVVREELTDGAEYFGPFGWAHPTKRTVSVIQRSLGVRVCRRMNPRGCLYMHIGMCSAPCVGSIDTEAYAERVRQARELLRGNVADLRAAQKAKMRELADQMRFEEAAEVRDYLSSLDRMMELQSVHLTRERDDDFVALGEEAGRVMVCVLKVRGGKVIDKRAVQLDHATGLPDGEVLAAAIPQLYRSGGIPRTVAVPEELPNRAEIESALSERAGRRVHVIVPRRGAPVRLMRLAVRNARAAARSDTARRERRLEEEGLEQLAEGLGLPGTPQRIEAFDVSHHHGEEAVASMVTFKAGRPLKKDYRRFRVREAAPGDDYAAMREVVRRRYGGSLRATLQEPDLVLIDGGRGQLSAASEALAGLGMRLPVAALAKEREELFVPGRSRPVPLAPDSDAVLLLRRVRDEAHRFAISHHRRRRRGALTRSRLQDVPGIGPKRTAELLRHFGSLRAVEAASVEELAKAPGLGPGTARRLWEALHPKRQEAPMGRSKADPEA